MFTCTLNLKNGPVADTKSFETFAEACERGRRLSFTYGCPVNVTGPNGDVVHVWSV